MPTPHPSLQWVDHRPWPLPERNWLMRQTWEHLLFIHYPMAEKALRERIPPELEIDTYDGSAWIGVVPFDMKGVTPRGFPAPSLLSDFPEINVRTYVIKDGKPGVWFFSLDITNPLAVWVARTFFHLPYYRASIQVDAREAEIHYREERTDRIFDGTYRPQQPVQFSRESFEHWSTERYCLYTTHRKGRLYRGDIHHRPWPLQKAELDIKTNTLTDPFPVGSPHPSILYSRSIDVVVWSLEKIH